MRSVFIFAYPLLALVLWVFFWEGSLGIILCPSPMQNIDPALSWAPLGLLSVFTWFFFHLFFRINHPMAGIKNLTLNWTIRLNLLPTSYLFLDVWRTGADTPSCRTGILTTKTCKWVIIIAAWTCQCFVLMATIKCCSKDAIEERRKIKLNKLTHVFVLHDLNFGANCRHGIYLSQLSSICFDRCTPV